MRSDNVDMDNIKIIIPGGLNTDITGLGVDRIIGSGELSLGGKLQIGPGGKARNMAQMCGTLMGPGKVAMLGKTVCDPFGLWKVPLESLEKAGVSTESIRIKKYNPDKPEYPGIALIPVDKKGENQIYVLPGINSGFSPDDLFSNRELFEQASGFVLMALEIPLETVLMALVLAESNELRVVLDPGGIGRETADLLRPSLHKVFLLKPNEYEAEILTGIRIQDHHTARKAALEMMDYGVDNVLITHGARGAYLFGKNLDMHIPVPEIEGAASMDATGCGDQVSATITCALEKGFDIEEAARLAVRAGTLQFNRAGIIPVSNKEIFE